jgi:cell division protein FtsL
MEAILNFIKEALAGKKMSAQWIVTIAVAVAGLAWSATLIWQEYNNLQGSVAELESKAHNKTPAYDDAPMSGRVTANSDAIIKIKENIKSLESNVNRLEKDIDKAEDKFNNRDVNPLSL